MSVAPRRLLAAVLAAVLAATALGAAVGGPLLVARAASTPQRLAPAGSEVFGFLPWWELEGAAAIDLGALTTLAWFGLEAGRDGLLVRETKTGEPTKGWAGWTSDAFAEVMLRARAAGVRVVLTVQRFSWSTSGARTTTALLNDPQRRATLVADIVSAVTERGADGVNLDVEPLPASVREGFVALVRELRTALDAADPQLQLTLDVTAGISSYPLERLTGPGAADAALVMGYDYRTAGSRTSGSIAPLQADHGLDLAASVKRALKRVPAERVILALPWYGRAWSTTSAEAGAVTRRGGRTLAPSTAWYDDATARAIDSGRRYDPVAAAAWSVYQARACETCPVGWRQVWYDDVDAFGAKVGFALDRGLRGVGIWALGYQGDRPELWSTLRYALGGTQDTTDPSGTVELAPQSVLGEVGGRPLVGSTVTLDLGADDADGSGVAFVRVGTGRRVTADGRLRAGTTFPATDSITVSMPRAEPLDTVFVPGAATASAAPDPMASPSVAPAASPADGAAFQPLPGPEAITRTIRVQWRDVAGNWSAPLTLRVLYEPGGGTAGPAAGGA